MAVWLNHQRQSKKKGKLPADRAAILEATPGWSWGTGRDYEEVVSKFCALRERLGRNPIQRSRDPTEKKMAKWQTVQRAYNKNGTLPADRVAILQAIPWWSWGKPRKPRKNAT